MKTSRLLFIFIFALACLYLAFSSTVTLPYVRHDSVRYFHKFYNNQSDSQTNPQHDWSYAVGRPFLAEFEEFVYQRINHLSDMSRLRFITIAVFAFCASLLAGMAISLGVPIVPAVCLNIAIFTLPGIQECVFVPFISLAVSILLTLAAYTVWNSQLWFIVRIVTVIILLEVVFFSYPTASFFFLIPSTFLVVISNDWKLSRKIWLRDIPVWAVSAVVYYFVLKMFFYTGLKLTNHEAAFSYGDVVSNIKTFFFQGITQSFNLWNIYCSQAMGLVMIAVASIALLGRWGRGVMITINFIIFNMVWFLFGGYLPRTFVEAQAFVLILIYWSGELMRKEWLSKVEFLGWGWPVSLMLIGLVSANIVTVPNVWNSNMELMFIRSRLTQYSDSFTKEIRVIRAHDSTHGYTGLPVIYDNFNSGTTADYEIPDLIRVSLRDLYDPPTEMHCIVTYSDDSPPVTSIPPHTVIIDMNDLVTIAKH